MASMASKLPPFAIADSAVSQTDPDPESYLWTCPNCGARLQPRQCKARCARCGFFTDCSDTGV